MEEQINARVILLMMAGRIVGDYVYSWGGEEVGEGSFDCSGFDSVVLMQTARAWPTLYDGGRTTARGLYQYYHKKGCPSLFFGNLFLGTYFQNARSGGRSSSIAKAWQAFSTRGSRVLVGNENR